MPIVPNALLTIGVLFAWSALVPTVAPPVWVRTALPRRHRFVWLSLVALANLAVVAGMAVACLGLPPLLSAGLGLAVYFAMAPVARRASLWLLGRRPVRRLVSSLWRRGGVGAV